MRRTILASVLTCAHLTLSACGSDRDSPLAVARIDGEAITVEEFRAELERRRERQPALYEDASERRALLDELVLFESFYARAKADGFHRHPELVESFRKMVVSTYRASKLEENAKDEISPAEVASYYREHRSDFRLPGAMKAAMIFVRVSARAGDRARQKRRERATAARHEALALSPSARGFGDVARRFSDDQASRYVGGELGWVGEGGVDARLDAEAADALFALEEVGDVSPVIEGDEGFYLLKVVDVRPERVRTLAECRPAIVQKLSLSKRERRRADLDHEVRRLTDVEIDEDVLSTISVPASIARAQ
ncbi:MAG: peptidylprolyl isomerase [Planctomycetota bacterium]